MFNFEKILVLCFKLFLAKIVLIYLSQYCNQLAGIASILYPLFNLIDLLGNDFLNLKIFNAIQRGGNLFLQIKASHGDILLFPEKCKGIEFKMEMEMSNVLNRRRNQPIKTCLRILTCFL